MDNIEYQTGSSFYSTRYSSQHCVIVGDGIDAMVTATVLASMGHTVTLYADDKTLAYTLATYTFEHQLQALWQLYMSDYSIVIEAIPNDALSFFNKTATKSADLYWLFYSKLPEAWHNTIDGQEIWATKLNESKVTSQTPFILSGIEKLGTFAKLATDCHRPWIYYIPFVFLTDGQAYTSMLSPTLWLMGEKTADSSDKIPILQPLMTQAGQLFITDIVTIEFSRSAIMSMLATRVSFMNEWSRLADNQGVDITEVAAIMGLDARIGKSYLKAGWGFGGKTLPAEIDALQDTFAENRVDHRLMQAVNDINNDQKELIFRKFWQYFDGAIEDKAVVIWGASYKSGSGRTSASAIHPLLRLLWSYNIKTYIYAAEAEAELASLYPNQSLLTFIQQPTAQLEAVNALFVLAWSPTQRLPIAAINDVVIPVFDASNIFNNSQVTELLGSYIGIGRGK